MTAASYDSKLLSTANFQSVDKEWLRQQELPRHVAIVMDGNGRWAQRRFLPRIAGHRSGVEAVRTVVSACTEFKIEALTLFAFSSENWLRPITEVNFLMSLFQSVLKKELRKMMDNNIRLRVIGEVQDLNAALRALIHEAEEQTARNTGLQLNLAVNYGGRWDILTATRRIVAKVQSGELAAEEIVDATFEKELSLADCPAPDLFIRTSGEMRLSNFLLWQLAYTEMIFMDMMWPDVDEEAFLQALYLYTQRTRRFGRTGEQCSRA